MNLLTVQWPEYEKYTFFGSDFIKQNLGRLNQFWRDVFKALCRLSASMEKTTSDEFLKEPIWFNKDICIDRKSVYKKKNV